MQRKLIRKDKWQVCSLNKHSISSFIPLSCIGVLLVLTYCLVSPNVQNVVEVYAAEPTSTDSSTSTGSYSETGTTNSSSISLSNYNVSTTASHGITAIAGTTATINVTDAESYNLILSVEDENLVNGTTTIKPGNAVDDNTWGYEWLINTGGTSMLDDIDLSSDASSTYNYSPPSINGSTLVIPELDDNGSVSFIGNLVFAVKFGNGAISGKYGTMGKLSLVTAPKAIVFDGISTMQEMTPEICEKASVGDVATLNDTRDNSRYSIRKMEDNRCWMTSNLKITGTVSASGSDFSSPSSITIPNEKSGFTSADQYALKGYVENNTGYYNWYTATAQAGTSSVTTNGQGVSTSICPSGWKLPTGGRTYTAGSTSEWYNLIIGGIFDNNSTYVTNTKNNNYFTDSNAVSTLTDSTYKFNFTGYVNGSSLLYYDTYGSWWSSTAGSSTGAYRLVVNSNSDVSPGSSLNDSRYHGYAVRCIAADPDLTEITTMQEMTSRVCEKSATGATNTLTDTRDGSKYSIRKMEDGKCWMTQNLKIMDADISSQDSDLADGETYYVPASNKDDFDTSNSTEASFLGADANGVTTGYYTWCTATAGTCFGATSQGAHATSSICPKSWRVPGGYGDIVYGNEFRALFLSMSLTISNSSLAGSRNGYTAWGTGDLYKVQSSPYNFNYTGYMNANNYNAPLSYQVGRWWSSTADASTNAYRLDVNSSNVYPGTNINGSLRYGYAIRCIAK